MAQRRDLRLHRRSISRRTTTSRRPPSGGRRQPTSRPIHFVRPAIAGDSACLSSCQPARTKCNATPRPPDRHLSRAAPSDGEAGRPGPVRQGASATRSRLPTTGARRPVARRARERPGLGEQVRTRARLRSPSRCASASKRDAPGGAPARAARRRAAARRHTVHAEHFEKLVWHSIDISVVERREDIT